MIKKVEDRNYIIFNVSEIDSVDFNQVMENSSETVRKSIDEQKTFVKWEGGKMPSSLVAIQSKEGPFNYDEMIKIMATKEWMSPDQNR